MRKPVIHCGNVCFGTQACYCCHVDNRGGLAGVGSVSAGAAKIKTAMLASKSHCGNTSYQYPTIPKQQVILKPYFTTY